MQFLPVVTTERCGSGNARPGITFKSIKMILGIAVRSSKHNNFSNADLLVKQNCLSAHTHWH